MGATYLQRHQQTLPLDVSETEIDATGVTVDVAVSDDVFNARVDAVDEAVRELFNPSMIPLSRIRQRSVTTENELGCNAQYPCTRDHGKAGSSAGTWSASDTPQCSQHEHMWFCVGYHQRRPDRGVLTAISCFAILAASPIPTTNAVGRVPLRSPRSCPPPLKMGSKRTRGRRLTYAAPTPFGP